MLLRKWKFNEALLQRIGFIFLLGLSFLAFPDKRVQAQSSSHTISGTIRDAKNGETLIGATVYASDLKIGASSNTYGFYSLKLPDGKHSLVVNYVGYKTIKKEIEVSGQNIKLNFELEEDSKEFQTVEVLAERPEDNVKRVEMSTVKLDIKTINKIPALLGEVDVIRSIQLLPGVSTVGEGATGFNVRGGSIDQNLVLLDEAPVYNSSHLFGLFSVFNPDAVKDVKLVKGGIPAQYGGRLSSLLDVRLKEGNMKQPTVSGGIGAVFSRLSVEAPIVKDKGSFIIAGRRSYGDVFLRLAPNEELRQNTLYFYDFTAKANYEVGKNDRLFVSAYLGRDVFRFNAENGFDWGNTTTSIRWNHLFNDKLFLNTTAFYSNYDYRLLFINNQTNSEFNWRSNIINYSIKPEFTYFLNANNTLTFGVQSTFYDFRPGTATARSAGDPNVIALPPKYALENGIFLGNEQKFNERWSAQYGLRYSNFQYLGAGSEFIFADTTAGIRRRLIEERPVSSGEVISNFGNWEPRLSIKYEVDENSSIKASYNRMVQYIHLISNSLASTPLDVWTPSTNNIPPELSDQIAVGYFRNFKQNMFETSVELYYKTLQNQIEYVSSADLLLNRLLEADLIYGKGRAYGAEFYVKKNTGDLTGFISYTLARTERQTPSINRGNWYPSRFDRTHNLSVVLNYELNKKWSFGANFIYSSGIPATFPTNRIVFQGIVIPHNVDNARNNLRQPAYHRLDISATLQGRKKQEGRVWYKNFESYWVFSAYNVYLRRNPYTLYMRINENDLNKTEAVRFAVFGFIIPSVTYNFKF